MSSDFLLIYGEAWQSIHNALKKQEMNLQELQSVMVQTGSPACGGGLAGGLLHFSAAEILVPPGRP